MRRIQRAFLSSPFHIYQLHLNNPGLSSRMFSIFACVHRMQLTSSFFKVYVIKALEGEKKHTHLLNSNTHKAQAELYCTVDIKLTFACAMCV